MNGVRVMNSKALIMTKKIIVFSFIYLHCKYLRLHLPSFMNLCTHERSYEKTPHTNQEMDAYWVKPFLTVFLRREIYIYLIIE